MNIFLFGKMLHTKLKPDYFLPCVFPGLLRSRSSSRTCRRGAAAASSGVGNTNRRSGPGGSGHSGPSAAAAAAAIVSPSAREANLDSAKFKPSCVIFDKDGTLVCFHTMWSPWCTSLANRYESFRLVFWTRLSGDYKLVAYLVTSPPLCFFCTFAEKKALFC